MKLSNISIICLLAAPTASAWTLKQIRNAAASALVAGTVATSPMVAGAVDFSGTYTDPNHPGCPRTIDMAIDSSSAAISGKDGNPDCGPGKRVKQWKLAGEVKDKSSALEVMDNNAQDL